MREATYIGKHSSRTQKGLRLGILLFICFQMTSKSVIRLH